MKTIEEVQQIIIERLNEIPGNEGLEGNRVELGTLLNKPTLTVYTEILNHINDKLIFYVVNEDGKWVITDDGAWDFEVSLLDSSLSKGSVRLQLRKLSEEDDSCIEISEVYGARELTHVLDTDLGITKYLEHVQSLYKHLEV